MSSIDTDPFAAMNTAPSTTAPARIRVFWQPGCTSCLRTKEFLTRHGIEFESIDVHNDADGMRQLLALGVRSVPVVALGDRYTYCQSFGDVIRFLDLKVTLDPPLPPDVLVAKLGGVLETAARLLRQFTPEQIDQAFGNRRRTPAGLGFHLFRVAEMGLQAAGQQELRVEGFNELPPPEWGASEIATWGLGVRTQVLGWWAAESDRTLQYTVPTYYGRRTMHDVLERTAWHAAQHCRQLAHILQAWGTPPDRPLSAAELAGLPVPEEVWDR